MPTRLRPANDVIGDLLVDARLGRGGSAELSVRHHAKSESGDLLHEVDMEPSFIGELMEADAYHPVIDRTYPLDQIVDAARYVETERKTGNLVLVV